MSGLNNQCLSGGLSAPVDATDIADGSVDNTEFETLDGVTGTIQTTTLADGKVWIGNAANTAVAVTPSGDFTITNLGVAAISAGVVVDNDINATANITLSKLASLNNSIVPVTDGSGKLTSSTTTATQLSYVDATSSIQTQLNGKQASGNYITDLTGDVTASGPGSVAGTIANSAVTNAKMANMADQTIKGNVSGGSAAPSDLTAAQVNTMTGAVVGPGSATDNGFVKFDGTTGKLVKNSAATISNSDVASNAAIDFSKLATLASGNILVGSAGGVATSVAMSSQATISNTGAVTLDNAAVIGKVLTGYTSGAGTVASTDTILQAIQKLNGNIAAINANQSFNVSNLGLATSVGSSALTIALKTGDGNDPSAGSPVAVGFRHGTVTTGQFTTVSITGALSIVVPSGATLGQRDGIESTIYIYLINNSGTAELAVSRSYLWDECSLLTTTTIGTGADSASVFYSTTGRSNLPARLIGKLVNTQSTSGDWQSAGTELCVLPFEIKDISCLMVKTSAQNPGTTTATKTTFDSVAASDGGFDPWSMVDLSNERLIAPKAGRYCVFGTVCAANFEASATLQFYLYKSGSSWKRYDILSAGVGNTRDFPFCYVIDLAQGAYIEMFTGSAADSSYSIQGSSGLGDSQTSLGMFLIK